MEERNLEEFKKLPIRELTAQEYIDVLIYTNPESRKKVIRDILKVTETGRRERKKFDELTPQELSAVLEHHYIFDNKGSGSDRYLILYEGQEEGDHKEVGKYYIPEDLKKIGDFEDSELLCRLIFYRGSCEDNGPAESLFHQLIVANFIDDII